jgi:hypothetical protein
MAVPCDFVVNEVLCYLFNKFDRCPQKQIKTIVLNFYTCEELIAAKDLLFAKAGEIDVSDIDVEIPRNKRRLGDNKSRLDLDDILHLMTLLDEHKLTDKLSTFVAAKLERIPDVKIEDIDSFVMARKIEQLEIRMSKVETRSVTLEIDSSGTSGGPAQASESKEEITPLSAGSGGLFSSSAALEKAAVAMQAAAEKLSFADMLQPASAQTSDNWFKVGANGKPINLKNQQGIGNAIVAPSSKVKPKRARVLGDNVENNSGLKSAVPIVKKSVLLIDNLSADCTPVMIEDHLKHAEIKVLNCFVAKSWVKSKDETEISAMRICVPAESREAVMNSQLWPSGVLIRDWKFKVKALPVNSANGLSIELIAQSDNVS